MEPKGASKKSKGKGNAGGAPAGKKGGEEETKSNETGVPKSIYAKDGKVYIVVNAKPNAKTNAVQGIFLVDVREINRLLILEIDDEGVGISISAVPKDGAANEELVDYLGDVLGVKGSEIDLDKGSKSRSKLVCVSAKMTPAEVYEALKNAS
jgi:uncharacterized protein YggU (UPF0235/DUF167 family)